MSHSGKIDVAKGLQAVANAAAAYRKVWESACKHDGITPDAKFVVFSDDNPYTQFLGPALQKYQETKASYEAGGYVGLKIERG